MQMFIFSTLAFLGFLVSVKLWREHGMVRPMYCPKQFNGGCDIVKHSKYAWFLGAPVAMWGSFYYLVFMAALSLPYVLSLDQIFNLASYPQAIMLFLILYPLLGFVFSLRLLSVQIFKLHALCFWCLLQSIIASLMFLYSYYIFFS